jgi:hypothetical protein
VDETAEQVGDGLGAPAPPARSRRGPLWVALAAVLVAALAGGVVVANAVGDDDPDADEVLRDARTALAHAQAYRFHVETTDRTITGEEGGAGTDTTMRTVADGEVRGRDWHTKQDVGDDMGTMQATSVGGQLYVLDPVEPGEPAVWGHWPAGPAPTMEDLAEMLTAPQGFFDDMADDLPPEVRDQLPDDVLQEASVGLLGAVYLGELAGSATGGPLAGVPGDPGAALDGLGHPTVVAHHGGTPTVRGTITAPDALATALKGKAPAGTVEVDVAAGGRPEALRLTVTGGKASYRADLRWSDWDAADIAVAKPTGTIDETPWVDEARIAEVARGLTPVGPTDLPARWDLQGIDAFTAAAAAGDVGDEGPPECPSIDLFYGPAGDSDGEDGVDVTLQAADCSRREDPTPFAPGAYGSALVRNADEGGVEVLVGDTVAMIGGSAGGPDLAAMVGSLRPLDLGAAEAKATQQAQAEAMGGGGSGLFFPL